MAHNRRRMKTLLLLLFLGLSCAGREYFPKGCFASREDSQKFKAEWYSSQLTALEEGPLYGDKIDPQTECYRFTWLRSFHHPVVFRIDVQANGTGQFLIKVGDGAGGGDPGRIVRNEKRVWDERMVEVVRARFVKANFFDVPSYEEGRLGTDGSEWIIEAVRDGKYHVVSRWSPESGPIHTIGMQLIEIAIGGDFTPIY